MIANSSMLVSEYSSVILLALALNKDVYCDCNLDEIKKKAPYSKWGHFSTKNSINLQAPLRG